MSTGQSYSCSETFSTETQHGTVSEVSEEMLLGPYSYGVEFTDFVQNFRSLLKTSKQCGEELHASWLSDVKKISNSFDQVSGNADCVEVYKRVFLKFVDSHREIMGSPILGEDDLLMDGPFKSLEYLQSGLGAQDESQSHGSEVGLAVSFDELGLKNVRIPIGTIYRFASSKRLEDPSGHSLFPTLVLLDFYAVCAHSLGDDHPIKSEVVRNLSDLCEVAESISPGSGPGSALIASSTSGQKLTPESATSTVDSIFDAFSQFGFVAQLLSNSLGGNVTTSDFNQSMDGMKNVIKSVVGHVVKDELPMSETGEVNRNEVLGRLGGAFQSTEVQKNFSDMAETMMSIYSKFVPPQPSTPSSTTHDSV